MTEAKLQKATFGGGCFWGVEKSFSELNGVESTRVGYMGGDVEKPTYENVCSDTTGHAEVVEVTYDKSKISYKDLLEKFFEFHDPTQLDKQGPDVGKQYRSVIFYHNNSQEKIAKVAIKTLQESRKFSSPIVTQLDEATNFWEAEDYHQQYLAKRRGGVCH